MDMKDFRAQIDEIDGGLIDLITRRFAVVRDIAAYKAKNNIPIYDPARERQKLNDLANSVGEELAPAMDALFSLIFDLSRSEQNRIFAGCGIGCGTGSGCASFSSSFLRRSTSCSYTSPSRGMNSQLTRYSYPEAIPIAPSADTT